MIYELIPRYSSRQSFYGKAHVIQEGDNLKLQSYSTIVAEVERLGGKEIFKYYGHYSSTTTSHQKEFFKQLGLNDKEIKELFKKGELVYE